MVTRFWTVLDLCFGFALLSSRWVVGGVTVSIDATNKVGAVPVRFLARPTYSVSPLE